MSTCADGRIDDHLSRRRRQELQDLSGKHRNMVRLGTGTSVAHGSTSGSRGEQGRQDNAHGPGGSGRPRTPEGDAMSR